MNLASRFSNREENSRWVFLLFLGFYLLFTLATFRDYGITIDEWDSYHDGAFLLKHWYHGNSASEETAHVFDPMEATHNYTYAAFLHILSVLNAEKLHFFNLLFALFIYGMVYRLLLSVYAKPWQALLGPIFLFLTLRFSGDVPANPKDAPFAILYFCSLAWIYLSRIKVRDPRVESILLGTLFGITTGMRVIGASLFLLLIFYRGFEYALDRGRIVKNTDWKKWVFAEGPNFLLVFLVSQFWMVALWPYLGSNYFGNIGNVFLMAKKFPWSSSILFMGKMVPAPDLPWYYLPVWMGISIPVFILAFFLVSPWFFKSKITTRSGRLYVLFVAAFGLNLGADWVLRPVIYNALRHFLFLVPLVVVLGTMGLIELFKKTGYPKIKKIVGAGIALNVLLILMELVRLYPYQYVYFNEMVGYLKGAAQWFETDYWYASSREATLWLKQNEITDPARSYRIKIDQNDWQQLYFFSPNMKGFLQIEDPDYEITQGKPLETARKKLLHSVEREGVPLASVLKYTPE